MLASVHLVLTVSSDSSAPLDLDFQVCSIVRGASDPLMWHTRTPVPVEYLWRNTGLNQELSILSSEYCSFMSRVTASHGLCHGSKVMKPL
jgi:hypothetical protein